MKKYIPIFVLLVVCFLSVPMMTQGADIVTAVLNKLTSYALKDPFYPDYPQRRILFPTTNLSWWGTPGLNKYTITSTDSRIRNKTVTFYSSGYAKCANGVEMGLPFGNALGSSYNHNVCSLSASDDFNFFFPFKVTTTQQATLDSPAQITSNGGLSATIYVPLSWWNN